MTLTANDAQAKEKITMKVSRTVHDVAAKICKELTRPRVNLTDYVDIAIEEKNQRELKLLANKKEQEGV